MKGSNEIELSTKEVHMNLNQLIYQNIKNSLYFRDLYELKTYHEVLSELIQKVTDLEPFLTGTTVSTAFVLLYKFYTLKLTVKQLRGLLFHPESSYAKAIGLLYLRYVGKPDKLWNWFEPLFDNDEEVQITHGPNPKISTIGEIAQDLLASNKFLDTTLPRIPVPIQRDYIARLGEYKRSFLSSTSYTGTKFKDSEAGESRRSRERERGRERVRDSSLSRERSSDRYRYKNQYRSEYRRKPNYRSRSRPRSRDSDRNKSGGRDNDIYRYDNKDRDRDRSFRKYPDESENSNQNRNQDRDIKLVQESAKERYRPTDDYGLRERSRDRRGYSRNEKPDSSYDRRFRNKKTGYTQEEDKYDEYGRLKKKK